MCQQNTVIPRKCERPRRTEVRQGLSERLLPGYRRMLIAPYAVRAEDQRVPGLRVRDHYVSEVVEPVNMPTGRPRCLYESTIHVHVRPP
jgi:hypothetical protein